MKHTRREFLMATAGAAAFVAVQGVPDVEWTPEEVAAAGWEPGLETRLNSACLLCPARCGIRGRVVDGRLVRIMGNPLHPLSQGGVCPRGIAGVQLLYHPERLASPLLRAGPRGSGQWEPVSTERAVAVLTDRLRSLREAGHPERLALVSGYSEGTMRDLWQQFMRAFGSPNDIADEPHDGADAVMSLMHGIARRPGYDLERSGLVLSFGAPLFESWWSPLQAFTAFGRPGAADGAPPRPRFVQVDTRFSRTAARAHEWVGTRPGTYGTLALGIAYVLIKEELYDASFVERHVSGFEDQAGVEGYRSLVLRGYRTEEVSAVTGVPVERIVALAKLFAERQPSVAVLGADVMLAPDGLLAGMAVHSLNVLMGSVNRPGGVLFADPPPVAPLEPLVLDDVARKGLGMPSARERSPAVGAGEPARRFAEAVAEGRVSPEVLLLYEANPLETSTAPDAWRAALERVPFVVSFSPFLDATAAQADLVVPDLLPYERWQDAPAPASFPYPVWAVTRPLVQAGEDRLATGDFLLAVARQLGGSVAKSLPYEDVQAALKGRARGLFAAQRGMVLGDEFERTHYRQMEERGWWLKEYAAFDPFWEALVERGGWTDLFYDDADPARLAQTTDGRIALLPRGLNEALRAEGRGRQPYMLSAPAPSPNAEYPLRLLPYRVSTLSPGTLPLVPWLAEQPTILLDEHWVPWVEVHPATAEHLGFSDGTMVWVQSAHGRYRARLKVFPGTARDNVLAPYGVRHPGGEPANPLHLLDGSGDPLTGLPSWSTTFVRLERA